MNWLIIINGLVVAIGIPTIIGALIFIGRKLQILDSIETDLKDNLRPDVKDVRERLSSLEGKYAGFMQTASPVALTPAGSSLLEASGLKKYIDDNFESNLFPACTSGKEIKNAYDVQKCAFSFFEDHVFPTQVEEEMKTAAYNQGADMSVLRRIGAIYFRDKCLEKLSMNPKDIDETSA